MALKTIPQLPSDDFDETVRFYAGLGFSETACWPNEYLILGRRNDELELHFWFSRGLDPLANDFSCYVRSDSSAEALALYDEWAVTGLDAESLRPPTSTDYGLLEFALIDPHANLVRVGGPINSD